MKRNKSYIINKINEATGIPKSKAKMALNVILSNIAKSLGYGEKVYLAKFGTFDIKTTSPRKYRKITTGEICLTESKRIPVFRPSSSLSVKLNDQDIPKNKQRNFVVDESGCKIIFSKPNPIQTDSLRIGFTPIMSLVSIESYPIVLMPQEKSFLKLPREGRSDVRGYKEAEFLRLLRCSDFPLSISDNKHLSILGRYLPYEPDYVLYSHDHGLYIDVEIDEPYDGYSRVPTHIKDGQDSVRDNFFIESGWVVVRFTEHQVHNNPHGCIQLLRHLVNSLLEHNLKAKTLFCIESEIKWSANQAIVWERNLYREKYLGIQSFAQNMRNIKVICHDKTEIIENQISRTPVHNVPPQSYKTNTYKPFPILFDEKTHVYYPSLDPTGSSDFISVTTLIEQFFPHFDIDAYVRKKMQETGKSEQEIRNELTEPADRGTKMHKDIENFLKGKLYNDTYKEFELFKKFYNECILPRNLKFYDAEKIVEIPQHNIAGTVDALFQKENGEFVIVDWKRSKHLIIDGYPKKFGFGKGLSVLSHLENSSYYKYEMQQSFYKFMLEKEYRMRISSMILVVLHPEYDQYYTIKLSNYREKEVKDLIEIHDRMLK